MSRTIPWRNKPTQLINQMIPVVNQYTLYLVHQTGPTSFVFKDDNDNKFKVSIGSSVNCSCGIIQNDHCIHTLYTLMKKFKVPSNNPILWQASYLDSELEGFVQLKYAQKKKQQRKKHQFKKVHHANLTNQEDNDDFPPLDEDSMCPICYEDMNEQCYSTCKICKKSLHTKCFKIWTKHKEDSNVPVTCPMCRSEFQNPMVIIYKDFQKWQSRFQTHKGTNCKGCGMKNIKGTLYKCLICSHTQLCKMCYEGNQHGDHDRYFVKNNTNQNWKIAPLRIKKTKKQLFQPLKQQIYKQLSDIKDQQFILDLFPSLKQYNGFQQISQLGIVGNQILPKQLCFKCKTGGNQQMKRLFCGHALHEQCLRSMIINKQYMCEIDNEIICPGYFQSIGIKVTKPKKKPVESLILKNQESINRINDNINRFEINGFVTKTKAPQKRNLSSGVIKSTLQSKDKNFRIMKKTLIQKKYEDSLFGAGNLGAIMITGFGQPTNANILRQNNIIMPPKPQSTLNKGSYK